ncbi:MAG: GTPase ObgE [Cyclobacteriaceae bacterium]|nr:GTPase ObgE [Cyclobacteriaceae bacterium HetDA_MAG_MS6]
MESNFIDYVKFFGRSGAGGAGSVHFRREKFVPKGGPDGGDGGRGGHITLKGNKQLWTLLHLKYRKHIRAEAGKPGEGGNRTGADGEDIILEVPVGTIARDADSGEKMLEILEDGEQLVLLSGGRGGQGNSHYKTPTNQAPRFAQTGEEAIERSIVLELKLLADVGLVGFPNAGKSTLLSTVSAARPEIADYPFTTLTPNLGVVEYHDYKSFVMADIPGIIEGAAEGRGLGTRFLRHIERNSLLLFMIPADSDDIASEYKVLLNELQQHNPDLIDKTKLLAITKSDLLDEELEQEIAKELPKVPNIFISSITQQGIGQLKNMIWDALQS